VPHTLEEVGRLDAVVISHNHYDHLDAPTLKRLPRGTSDIQGLSAANMYEMNEAGVLETIDYNKIPNAKNLMKDQQHQTHFLETQSDLVTRIGRTRGWARAFAGLGALALVAGSTQLSTIAFLLATPEVGLRVSLGMALIALVIVAIAENARIPVDNPATHLELTMVHEAMVLEYSGRHLAMIEFAASLKLLLYLSLIACVFVPWGIAAPGAGLSALTLGAIVAPTTLDPAGSEWGNRAPFYQAVFDTLLLAPPSGEIEPYLATDWSYNDDGTVLTLTLRDDVAFTDGAPHPAQVVHQKPETMKNRW
jgi:hypothetical protein